MRLQDTLRSTLREQENEQRNQQQRDVKRQQLLMELAPRMVPLLARDWMDRLTLHARQQVNAGNMTRSGDRTTVRGTLTDDWTPVPVPKTDPAMQWLCKDDEEICLGTRTLRYGRHRMDGPVGWYFYTKLVLEQWETKKSLLGREKQYLTLSLSRDGEQFVQALQKLAGKESMTLRISPVAVINGSEKAMDFGVPQAISDGHCISRLACAYVVEF